MANKTRDRKEYLQKYYQTNRERISKQGKIWREANKEKRKEGIKKWRRRNPERVKKWKRSYRKRHILNIRTLLGKSCKHCGITNANPSFLDIDHIVPQAKGTHTGKKARWCNHYKLSEIDNYQLLCPNCHRIKTLTEMEKRLSDK